MDDDQGEYPSSNKSRFRFKSKSKSRDRHEDGVASGEDHRRRHHRHRRHHRRHHKRKPSRSPPPDNAVPPLSPNAAFRESLFDALADDEGASYWEGVYGQPIHNFPRPEDRLDERGELEQMTDEEYTAYVRARMWEKTHEGLLEERERQRRAKERKQEERQRGRKAETEREAFERMIDDSLQRGQERQTKKRKVNAWEKVWQRYLESWEELNTLAQTTPSGSSSTDAGPRLRNLIFWPVESGKRSDITPEAVRDFMYNFPGSSPTTRSSGQSPSNILDTLKTERVRWHPDKIQHRYGVLGVEEQVLESVTEVFQTLDQIWVEERAKAEK